VSRVTRWLLAGGGAISMLVGLLIVSAAVIQQQGPVDWLDRNLDRTGDAAWLSHEPPLVTAERMAEATRPSSRVVNSWGVALRYAGGTATVVAGPRARTANVYWDASRRSSPRRYRFGRLIWDDTDGTPESRRTPGESRFAPVEADAAVQTRRGEDFRGGGPGGGK